MKILRYEILSQPWLATLRKQWNAKLVLIFQFIGRPNEYYKKCINVLIFLVCIILFKGRIWGPSYFVSNPFSPDSHEVFPPEPFSSQYFNSIRSYLTVVSVQCKPKLHKLNKKEVLRTLCMYPKSDKYFIPEQTPRAIPSSWCIESLEWCS